MSSEPFDLWDHWSASQIETFEMCNRKWWYNKRLKLKVPPTKSTNTGSLVHGEIERYLETGDESKLGIIARSGLTKLRELRALNPCVELPIGVDKRKGLGTGSPLILLAGVPGEGYIDVYVPGKHAIPQVWDHKTTGQMRYAKSEAELRLNHQLISYARAAQVVEGKLDSPIEVGHIVYLTESPYTNRVTGTTLSPEHIEKRIQVLDGVVSLMKQVADVRNEISVTPTWEACSAYRGCPFKERCHSTRNIKRLTSPPGAHMTLAEKLAAARGTPVTAPAAITAGPTPSDPTAALKAKLAATRAAPVTGVVPPDAPLHDVTPVTVPLIGNAPATPAVVPETVGVRKPRGSKDILISGGWSTAQYDTMTIASVKRVIAEKLIARMPNTAGWDVTPAGELVEVVVEAKAEVVEAPTDSIDLTSEAALRTGLELGWTETALTEVMSDTVYAQVIEGRLRAEEWTLSTDGDTLTAVPKPEPVAAPAAEVPKTRTRKAKTLTEANPNAADQTDTLDGGTGMVEPTLVLLIDAVPVRGTLGDVTPLENWLQQFCDTVAKHNSAPYYNAADQFNGGLKQVVGLVAANIPTGVFSANSSLPLTNAVLEILLPYANLVIRGVR